jgi:hypothetical protein
VIHFDVHGAVLGYDALQEGYETDQFLYQACYGRADIEKYEGLKAFLFLEGEKDDQADPVVHPVPAVFAGRDLAAAIRRARLELHNRKDRRAYFSQVVDLEDWLLPVVYQN